MLLGKLIGSLGISFLGGSFLCCLFTSSPAVAQIVPDNTLPQNSIVTPQGNIIQIDGGTRAGNNLFHSFEQFSVGVEETAHFNNAVDIQNILSRVTGGSISEINGILKANGVANLFLINPNGIIFGENASLDIGGSFFATSADSVVFGNGAEFSATNPNTPPLLTINIPVGLWFRENPGAIVNRSFATVIEVDENGEEFENYIGLRVPSGQTLALVGGDVSLEGGILTTPGGRVELGSVAGNSLVSLTPVAEGFVLGYEGVQSFQDISLSDLAEVNTIGERGGDIQIQGRQISLAGDSRIFSFTLGEEAGGDILLVAAESVDLIGSNTKIANGAEEGTGDGGDITIETRRLMLSEGAQISHPIAAEGNAGNLTIRASESVEIRGTARFEEITVDEATGEEEAVMREIPGGLFAEVGSSTLTFDENQNASGRGGTITIETGQLLIQDGAQVSTNTFGAGQAGNLIIKASDSVELVGVTPNFPSALFAQANETATGNGGNIIIETGQLLIQDGAQVSTDTFGASRAGNLTVKASESVELIRGTSNAPSALRAGVNETATGNGGNIIIETGQLLIQDGAQVSTDTFGAGRAGNLTVKASESVELLGTSANNRAASGLLARVEVSGTGDGGTLTVETPRLVVRDGAQIGTVARNEGQGGTLTINAAESIFLSGTSPLEDLASSSGIFVSAQPGATSNAGQLIINTPELIVEDGAEISADNFGTGGGSNVNLNVGRLTIRDGGQVGAGSLLGENPIDNERGPGGTLTINASEAIEVTGRGIVGSTPVNSRLFTLAEGTGDAGNLSISTPNLTVTDGGEVNVSATGTAEAGSLTVGAGSIRLEDGSLSAETRVGNQGNILLNAEDIQLRRGSEITTNSLETGTGGNIEIDTDVLVAIENSDISANALAGPGGQVIINAGAIFGTQFRPRQTNASDITATSELGAEFSGTVELNTQFDPSSAVIELPVTVVDPASLIAQEFCRQRGGSEFVNTGRGGLPPSPQESLRSEETIVELMELPTVESRRHTPSRQNSTVSRTTNEPISSLDIVPARGWIRNEKGEVILVSYDPTKTGVQRPRQNTIHCQPN
jgi:filamentous hemagglutinin family protein